MSLLPTICVEFCHLWMLKCKPQCGEDVLVSLTIDYINAECEAASENSCFVIISMFER